MTSREKMKKKEKKRKGTKRNGKKNFIIFAIICRQSSKDIFIKNAGNIPGFL
jgi:hypothetical protein